MPIVGTLQLNGCNYQFGYDLISQSVANNTSTISIYGILNVTNNYVAWSSGTASVHDTSAGLSTYYSQGSYVVVQTYLTRTHNNDGNLTLTIGYELDTTMPGGSGNGFVNITLPQIKRFATITNAPSKISYSEGTQPFITFSNPGNATNLNAWLEVNPVGTHLATRNINITSGTYTWELTSQEWYDLCSQIPNSNKGKIRLGLYSTQAGTTGVSYRDVDFEVGNMAMPEGSLNFTIAETNEKIINNQLTENVDRDTIKGYSNKRLTISSQDKAIAQMGATMIKYQFMNPNETKTIDVPYSESDVSGIIYGCVDKSYGVKAIDSRGNFYATIKIYLTAQFIDYSPISFNKDSCTLQRDNGQVGENAILTLDGYIWNQSFGNKTNEVRAVSYRLKKTDSETWITGTTTITPTLSGDTFTYSGAIASDNSNGKWDLDSSYNVEITIEDYLETSTISFILNSAKPTLCLDKKGVGVLCKYDSNIGGALQVEGKIIDGGTIIWTNANPTSNFNSQTITLDESLDNYGCYEIVFKQNKNSSNLRYFNTGKIPVGHGTILSSFGTNYRPTGTTVSGNTISFENAISGNTTNNENVIPIYVIGYKSNLFS